MTYLEQATDALGQYRQVAYTEINCALGCEKNSVTLDIAYWVAFVAAVMKLLSNNIMKW